jgi:class 3 adenylate cyclase
MLGTLNMLWQEYDKIARKWNMYKVETIGDAYLGVTGCPTRHPDHAIQATEFAIDIMNMIRGFRTAMGSQIQIRIGLNSGKITAGVLGMNLREVLILR